jgi:hypothetical protein
MTQVKPAEPPSQLQPPLFTIGQDCRGNWVVQDQKRIRGGLFVNRDVALRYVRAENGNHPRAVAMVSGVFELDMGRAPDATAGRQLSVDAERQRRTA